MKTKKCGVYVALAAVLLITAMLVITCTDPVIPGGSTTTQERERERETFTLPPGKAAIIVSIPTQAGRTIMPTDPTTGTLYYKVDIIGETGTNSGPYDQTMGDGSVNFATADTEVFVVDAGTYTVTVGAWTTDTWDADTCAAVGQATGVSVSSGGTNTANVTLEKIVDGTQKGVFVYDITLPTGFSSNPAGTVAVTVTPYSGTTPVHSGNTASITASPAEIVSGYYLVTATLTKAKYATYTFSEILHIYAGQTSSWAPTLTLNKKAWDVTLNMMHGEPLITELYDNSGNGWPNGGTVTEPSTPTRTGFVFDAWYKVASPVLDPTPVDFPWDFTPTTGDKIYRDTPLYATWTQSGYNLNVVLSYTHETDHSFSFEDDNNDPISTLNFTWAQANVAGGITTIEITVDDSEFDSIEGWIYNGRLVTNSNTLTSANIAAFNADVANADHKADLTLGGSTHTFTFIGIKGASPDPEVQYSGTFTINIGSAP